ncbi:hypothetical protein KIF24_25320 [Micromonospora sp. Llam7]|uniref:hypothetical protein n=1 Tax=Micromonospora tarapacensis TaxID=2835305 RepID=UPI001C8317CF|nr:hypothetical protein [Micromonospora tarapacensis]MBX7269017.1 hypothetical protein [Micromonospora tarapacensis]
MDALPVLDLCLRVGACHVDELRAEVSDHRALRGFRQARRLADLADPRSECRQESQLRLLLVDAGLLVPEPQFWVCDRHDRARMNRPAARPGRSCSSGT